MIDLTNREEREKYFRQVEHLVTVRKVGITVACCYANTYPDNTHYCSGHGAFGDGRNTEDCPSKKFCQQLHDKTFDYIGYIVKYDREYSNGEVFDKDAFKVNGPHTVPIIYWNNSNRCIGTAYLKHEKDGVVAKCRFINTDLGEFIKNGLDEYGDFGLTLDANDIIRRDDHIQYGRIQSVIICCKNALYTLKDE